MFTREVFYHRSEVHRSARTYAVVVGAHPQVSVHTADGEENSSLR